MITGVQLLGLIFKLFSSSLRNINIFINNSKYYSFQYLVVFINFLNTDIRLLLFFLINFKCLSILFILINFKWLSIMKSRYFIRSFVYVIFLLYQIQQKIASKADFSSIKIIPSNKFIIFFLRYWNQDYLSFFIQHNFLQRATISSIFFSFCSYLMQAGISNA